MNPIQIYILKGRATISPIGLRCQGPRAKQPDKACNKLLCKKTESQQIAGSFKCDRCGQAIEVEVRLSGV